MVVAAILQLSNKVLDSQSFVSAVWTKDPTATWMPRRADPPRPALPAAKRQSRLPTHTMKNEMFPIMESHSNLCETFCFLEGSLGFKIEETCMFPRLCKHRDLA